MTWRVCLESGCPEATEHSSRRCPAHRTQTRSPSSAVSSHPGWRRARAAALRRDRNRCVRCGAPAVHVDHIRPVVQGGAEVDTANLQSLCREHHREKGAEDRIAVEEARLAATTSIVEGEKIEARIRRTEARQRQQQAGPPGAGGYSGCIDLDGLGR